MSSDTNGFYNRELQEILAASDDLGYNHHRLLDKLEGVAVLDLALNFIGLLIVPHLQIRGASKFGKGKERQSRKEGRIIV